MMTYASVRAGKSPQEVLRAISRLLTDQFSSERLLPAKSKFHTEKGVAAVCSADPLNHEVLYPGWI